MKQKIIVILIILVTGLSSSRLHAQSMRKDTVTILSFNDFHGAFISGISTPGADNFMTTLLDIKSKVPNPVILSGGDNFSGSYYSLMSQGEPHQFFTLPLFPDKMISAVGNHEFDWGTDYLMDVSCNYIEYVSANLSRRNDNKTFKEIIPDYRIVSIGNGDDLLRIGVIGLATPTTPSSGKKPFVEEFAFDKKFASKVSSIAASLKVKSHVDIVILLMHIGTSMKDGKPVISDSDQESEKELRQIDDVDAIVSAHSHELVKGDFVIANGTKTVPMIQAGTNGSHIALLQFELSDKKATFLRDSLISVPVPNWEISQLVDSISTACGFMETIVRSEKEMVHDRNVNLHSFTEVGAIVTASYCDQYSKVHSNSNIQGNVNKNPIIAVHHFKGIRTGIPKGDLSRSQVGNILPFGGNLAAYRMCGLEIKRLFEAGMDDTQSRGRLQTCNLKFEMSGSKIIAIRWFDGNEYVEIKDDTECILLCDDFIAYGGDGYDSSLFHTKITDCNGLVTTNALMQFLKESEVVPNNRYMIPESTSLPTSEGGITIKGWETVESENIEVAM